MIHSVFIDPLSQKTYDLTTDQIQSALQDPAGLLWISLEHPTEAESLAILRDLFHFHPLSIDDALNPDFQTPKVDDFGAYLFIIMHAVAMNTTLAELNTVEVNFYLGANYLVTLYHEAEMDSLAAVWKRIERDERLIQNGSDFLTYGIIDEVVDDYAPFIDQLDEQLGELEDQVMATPEKHQMARLLVVKHALIFLRRVISPQREVMNRLSRDEFPMIDNQSRIYFRDIYDHLVRYQDNIESLRDIVSSALDIYLNSTSLRLNEIMKALTIVSTIFLPLSFFAGVYGMNFNRQVPAYDWTWGIEFFWGICLAVTAGMLWYFRRHHWF